MAKRRMISIDWIEALGRWPQSETEQIGENPTEENDPQLISLDDVPENVLGVLNVPVSLTPRGIRIENAVREALKKLGEEERELVQRYLMAGQSMTEMAELTGRRVHRLTTQYQRALRKLRKYLAPLVAREFGDAVADERGRDEEVYAAESLSCPICLSAYRMEIDSIIAARRPDSTWRPVIRKLRESYGIVITTPQILIGHQRYH